MLLWAVCCDILFWKVKNGIVWSGLFAGAVSMVLEQTYVSALVGLLLPILICWPLFHIRALGAGDIKLFSLIGFFYGYTFLPPFMLRALILGALLSLIQIFRNRNLSKRFRYFFHYIFTVYTTKKLVRYYEPESDKKDAAVHFSIAILGAFVWSLAGGYWKGV